MLSKYIRWSRTTLDSRFRGNDGPSVSLTTLDSRFRGNDGLSLRRVMACVRGQASRPWHCLNFLPEPHGQGSLRPTLAPARTNGGAATAVPPSSPGVAA